MKKKMIMFQLPVQEFTSTKTWGNIPLAAGMLKAVAYREGLEAEFDIEIVPQSVVNEAGDSWLIDYLAARKPDVVSATLYLWNARRSLYIAEQLKVRLPGLKVVVGGAEVSEEKSYVVEHPAVDYGCIGEGEEIFPAILRMLAGATVEPLPGLFRRERGRVLLTPGYGMVRNLDRLPSPWQMEMLEVADEPVVPYELMRDCPCSRSHCSTGTIPPRYVPVATVLEDLALLRDKGVKNVRLVCSNFLQHPEFSALCTEIARINADRRLSFSCFSYPEPVSAEKAEALKRCNIREIEFGMQTVNAKTSELLGRPPLDERRFLACLAHLRSAGIDFSVDLTAGLPGESREDIERSIGFLKNNGVHQCTVSPLQMLPGTRLKQMGPELGLVAESAPPYVVTRTDALSSPDPDACLRHYRPTLQNFCFDLAQEFQLPDFCSLSTEVPPSYEQSRGPVTKIFVPGAADPGQVDQAIFRGVGENTILYFPQAAASLQSFAPLLDAVRQANPFCRIMPVFEVASLHELEMVVQQCAGLSQANVVNMTLVKGASWFGDLAAPPHNFTLYQEVRIGSIGDIVKVSSCRTQNLLIDLSPELDPVTLRSVLELLVASGKRIQYRNLAFAYLDSLIRQRRKGEALRVSVPVKFGTIATLNRAGQLQDHLFLDKRMVLATTHMQRLFLEQIETRDE